MSTDDTAAAQRGPGHPPIGRPLYVRVSDDQRARIDQWQADHGMAKQAAAVRELIDRGLAAEETAGGGCG